MMPNSRYPLKAILHPYVFFLKEGGGIKKDFLDYSLMMLFIHSSETIKSPDCEDRIIGKQDIDFPVS